MEKKYENYVILKNSERKLLLKEINFLVEKKDIYKALDKKTHKFLFGMIEYLDKSRNRMLSKKQLEWLLNVLDKHRHGENETAA